MFQSGEIVHAAFPFTDLTSAKRRTCFVLAQCDWREDFLVAFITSSSGAPASASAVAVGPSHPEWRKTGLKRPSVIRVDKITTLHESVISGAIGVLPGLWLLCRRSNWLVGIRMGRMGWRFRVLRALFGSGKRF
jgi:mRNA interferase MazF